MERRGDESRARDTQKHPVNCSLQFFQTELYSVAHLVANGDAEIASPYTRGSEEGGVILAVYSGKGVITAQGLQRSKPLEVIKGSVVLLPGNVSYQLALESGTEVIRLISDSFKTKGIGEHGTIGPTPPDPRRTIMEYNFRRCSFANFTVHEPEPLGQCYWTKRFGIFVFTNGGGRILTRELNESGKPRADASECEIGPRSVISIPPFTAFTFIMEPGTKFVRFTSAPFNERDKDLNRFPLV